MHLSPKVSPHPALRCSLDRLARCAVADNPGALSILLYYAGVLRYVSDLKTRHAPDAEPDIAPAVAVPAATAVRILGKALPAAVAAVLAGAWVPFALTGLRILSDHSEHVDSIIGRLS
jgi:hypothetical protein